MPERWATFDCYGTLVDWDGGVSRVLRELWPDRDTAALLRVYHVLEPLVQEGRDLPYREVCARVLKAIAIVRDLRLPDKDRNRLAESLPTWPAFAEVAPALSRLRADGWKLAILSNTDPDLLAASRQQIGVPIDLSITAAEAGSYKPAHGHWQTFFARTGAAVDHHVHVGASPFHDLVPASELGLTSVWINRLAEHSDARRAAELTDLAGLPDVLERLRPSAH